MKMKEIFAVFGVVLSILGACCFPLGMYFSGQGMMQQTDACEVAWVILLGIGAMFYGLFFWEEWREKRHFSYDSFF